MQQIYNNLPPSHFNNDGTYYGIRKYLLRDDREEPFPDPDPVLDDDSWDESDEEEEIVNNTNVTVNSSFNDEEDIIIDLNTTLE